MEAVKVALNEIWYKTKWDWRYKWWSIDVENNVMWYEPPDDFEVSGAHFGVKDRTFDITFMTWEKLTRKWPYIRHVPVEHGDITSVTEAAQADYQGAPYYWTIKGGYVGFWPVPDTDFITATSARIIGGYYADITMPYEDSDELGIPMPLYPAHEFMTSAYFKQAMEWSDFAITEQRGRGLLFEAVKRQREVYLEESQLMPEEY
jgi:hypothetical protein